MSTFLTAFNSAMRAAETFRRSGAKPAPSVKPAPARSTPSGGGPVKVINPVAIGRWTSRP